MPHFQKDLHNFVYRQIGSCSEKETFPKGNQDWKQIAKKSGSKCRQKKDIALKILFHFIHQGTI